MLLWLSALPPYVSLVVALVAANVVALAVTFTARYWARTRNVTAGPAVVNCWAISTGGLSALLFAFAIVTLWNMMSAAQAAAGAESTSIRLVARDLASDQVPLLRSYVTESIDEWPRLCGGKPDPRVDATLTMLERVARPRAAEYADDLFRQLAAMENLRYNRWQQSGASAPFELEIALGIITIALLGVLGIALPERADTHAALTVLVACAFGVVFWVVSTLAYSYCGNHNVGPELMSAALREL